MKHTVPAVLQCVVFQCFHTARPQKTVKNLHLTSLEFFTCLESFFLSRGSPCNAVCCSVLQCVAVCCSVLQCVAVCCSVLQCNEVFFPVSRKTFFSGFRMGLRGHCNILQHTAAHCNTLQHTSTQGITLQHTAAHCNTLQCTGNKRQLI